MHKTADLSHTMVNDCWCNSSLSSPYRLVKPKLTLKNFISVSNLQRCLKLLWCMFVRLWNSAQTSEYTIIIQSLLLSGLDSLHSKKRDKWVPGDGCVVPVSDGMKCRARGRTDFTFKPRQQRHHHKHSEHTTLSADNTSFFKNVLWWRNFKSYTHKTSVADL